MILPVPYKDLEPVSKQLTIVVGLTVVGFMAFGLALSFYRNVLFDGTLQELGAQNDGLRRQNADSQSDLEYYRSAQFKDKYAKENLGRASKGERVLLLPKEVPSIATTLQDPLSPTEAQTAAYEEQLRQMPVIDHWKLFLFHRNRIEDLKRAL